MGYDTKISSNAREQLDQFTGIFFTRFSKPRLKFLRQMLYGIQITKSVILSKIAAEIDENIKQVKIEMRLCHHLAFKDLWKHIHEAVMEHAKKFVRKSTLIIIDPIRAEVGNKGIHVYDRGGDRNEIFRYFISCGLDFIVRMMQKRYLMYKGVRTNILVLSAMCHTPHTSVVAFNANGEEEDTTIHYGAMPVRLPEDPDFPGMHEKDLRLVVVRGFGQCAMLVLTTLQGDGSKEDVWRVVQGYLTRECAERSEGRSQSDGEAARQGPRALRRRYAS